MYVCICIYIYIYIVPEEVHLELDRRHPHTKYTIINWTMQLNDSIE